MVESLILEPRVFWRKMNDTHHFTVPLNTFIRTFLHIFTVMNLIVNFQFQAEHEFWSIAATIYHVATGQVPFEPINGRDNPQLMYEMLTQKGPAHISAEERGNSRIVFQTRFPRSCPLDKTIQRKIIPLLTGLFKVSMNHTYKGPNNNIVSFSFVFRFQTCGLLTKSSEKAEKFMERSDNAKC